MSLSTMNKQDWTEAAWLIDIVRQQEKATGPSLGVPTSPCYSAPTFSEDEDDLVFHPGSPSNLQTVVLPTDDAAIAYKHWGKLPKDVTFTKTFVQEVNAWDSGKKSKLYRFTQVKKPATPPTPPPLLDLGPGMASLKLDAGPSAYTLREAEKNRKSRRTLRKIKDRAKKCGIMAVLRPDDEEILEKQRLQGQYNLGKRVYAHPQVHSRKRARNQVARCLAETEAYISV